MLLVLLLTPILADMVPMAETTKTEVQTISPKIIQKGMKLFRLLDFNPDLRQI